MVQNPNICSHLCIHFLHKSENNSSHTLLTCNILTYSCNTCRSLLFSRGAPDPTFIHLTTAHVFYFSLSTVSVYHSFAERSHINFPLHTGNIDIWWWRIKITETCNLLKSTIFRDITPCTPFIVNRRFRGTYRLHLQGRKNKLSKKPAWKQVASKVCWYSTDYTALYPRRWYSS
jgi:hypothetical protein